MSISNKISHWKAPSNIALVKYWGKFGRQFPRNPSLSFSLNSCYTDTKISVVQRTAGVVDSLKFNNQENDLFKNRISTFIESIDDLINIPRDLAIKIETSNSFPHSAGIASSASGFGAIALGLNELFLNEDIHSVSKIARIGSGSAARSVLGGYNVWGETNSIENSSNEYSVNIDDLIHDEFQTINDAILIVSDGTKKISSSIGHSLMNGNIFADARYTQANEHLNELASVLKNGDWDDFISIVESEALTLHSLMMSSGYILLKPNSLKIIEELIFFRNETKLPICFTIDAGPNIHVLYPDRVKEEVKKFISSVLMPLCESGKIIYDKIGDGPRNLGNE